MLLPEYQYNMLYALIILLSILLAILLPLFIGKLSPRFESLKIQFLLAMLSILVMLFIVWKSLFLVSNLGKTWRSTSVWIITQEEDNYIKEKYMLFADNIEYKLKNTKTLLLRPNRKHILVNNTSDTLIITPILYETYIKKENDPYLSTINLPPYEIYDKIESLSYFGYGEETPPKEIGITVNEYSRGNYNASIKYWVTWLR